MNIIPQYVLYIILICMTPCFSEDKNIGDMCYLPVRMMMGICKKLADCPSARKQNAIGIKPFVCNRKDGIVVCCKMSASTAPDLPKPRVGPTVNSFIDNNPIFKNLRKSQQKCMQYSAPVQTTLFAAPLSIDRAVIPSQTSNCIFESKPLIYGGSLAVHGEFPHMALLGLNKQTWLCGGTLISEQYVLTAAHCFKGRMGNVTVVRLGELNIKKPELNSEPEDISVEKIIIHPEYTYSQAYNDIALVKLSRPVTLSTYIRPACLWNKLDIHQNNAIATGWGATEKSDSINDDLLKLGLTILEQPKCQDIYKTYNFQKLPEIRSNIICASANQTKSDTCQGDSGGPLGITDPHNECIHYVLGITSIGKDCEGKLPGIYTRVSSYIDWIEENVWP